ncbi:MAG: hypothetical protein ACE5JL_06105 [Dehalococcoidia bacterium]
MVSVPGFLLRRLYVKGSLANSPEGVRFQLKNSLGSGYAKGMLPVSIDGQEYPLEDAVFIVDGDEVPFSSVSEEKPFTIAMNKVISVLVKGASLEQGSHKLGMGFVVPGLGKLKFDVKDSI